ncbi:efflux RND transporter periplasmic adaptor subunit [Anabaenopsis elenkinii]|uniref:Efflux RND transporter periplasmic adaptor subunit n=1 Tax=Anabaenopsis elenkinii CCIBt3563 TaxID=2779889 RepID=A0A7S6U5F9_9CYAN|nr:efflux RND transporter periplasmic adaptor subunit [Anabaenopsis elenkinii]QOV24406.1 efflux RND transporter periplasmic adaptor subunit [Anabaenopsis elenkinii CCIBt3563]
MTLPEPPNNFGDNHSPNSDQPRLLQGRWQQLLLACILILTGGSAIFWRVLTPTYEGVPTNNIKTPGVRVKVLTPQPGIVDESLNFVASLKAGRSVEIKSKIPGQVTQIFLKPGDQVTARTAIIQVDSRPAKIELNATYQAAVLQRENARARLESLEAVRQSQVADLQLQEQDYQKYAYLATQGAISQRQQNQYANRVATTKADLGAINAQIQGEQLTISQAEKTLQQAQSEIRSQQLYPQSYTITAPFSGTVGNISVRVGDLVNTSTPLVTVSQNQPLELHILVPVEQSTQLRRGMAVEVLNPQGEVISSSTISAITPDAKNDQQEVLVKALFNNSQGQLLPDQLVQARVIWHQRPGVLIPTKAVFRVSGETFVYVITTEESPQGISQLMARQRRVKLGNIKDDHYQVLSGLQPEEKIVTSGVLNLQDGMPIAVE